MGGEIGQQKIVISKQFLGGQVFDVAMCVPIAEWLAEPEQYGVAFTHQINAQLRQLELRRRISVNLLHKENNLVHPTQSMLC